MSTEKNEVDLIDSLLGLTPGSETYEARRFRDTALTGTQASYDAIFGQNISLPLSTRLLVAVYVSGLSNAEELTDHYVEEAEKALVPLNWVSAVLKDDLSDIHDSVIQAILLFTRTLTLNPLDGDQQALLDLQSAGVSTQDCIALAQLIAFLSYQIRLVTGLKAMQALEV